MSVNANNKHVAKYTKIKCKGRDYFMAYFCTIVTKNSVNTKLIIAYRATRHFQRNKLRHCKNGELKQGTTLPRPHTLVG